MKRIFAYDDYNNIIHKDHDVIGCVRPMFSRNALRASWKIIEIYDENVDDAAKRDNEDEKKDNQQGHADSQAVLFGK